MMYRKGDRIEVEISDAADGHECFGRLDDGIGVLVSGVLAVGDRVEAEVRRVRRKHLRASFNRLLRPAPARVEPPCPYFGVCGGCKWQHVEYAEQLRVKQKLVADALAHLGGFEDVPMEPILPAEAPYGYRNKVDFTFGDRRYLPPGEYAEARPSLDGESERPSEGPDAAPPSPAEEYAALGFHAPGVYTKVLDIERCLLASPTMNEALEAVRGFLATRGLSAYSTHAHEGFLRNLVIRQSQATGTILVNLITTWADLDLMRELDAVLRARLSTPFTLVNGVTDRKSLVAFGDREEVISGPGVIEERLGPFTFTVSANSFFQTNTTQALRLYETVLDLAGVEAGETAYDLYCGTGSIALFLARAGARVLGFEAIESAVADARRNATANEVEGCRFEQLDLRDLGKQSALADAFGRPDVVVTDPPRAGMHPKAVEALLALAPRRIVYVSCKAASLARDAQMLCASGAYRLERVRPVDMFPQTAHVESVALLGRA